MSRLWHRLTLAIEEFVKLPEAKPYLIPLYENFIKTFKDSINSLSLVKYLTKAAEEFSTPQESLEFIYEQAKTFGDNPSLVEGYVTIVVKGASYKLILKDFQGCKKALEECEKLLEKNECSDLSVNAAYYQVYAQYYKEMQEYSQHYQTALLYLSAANIEELSLSQKQQIAYDLCISALLGEDLYNFGELLIHPILSYLELSPHGWLRQLLYCFNNGDIALFNVISQSDAFLEQPILVKSLPFLKQKLCLMTLVESIFRGTKEKLGCISFSEISKKTKVQFDEVEHLIMRALSLGLIKGKINQVEHYVSIHRIQPRVLDMDQINHLSTRLQAWSEDLKKYIVILDKKTESIDIGS